jgi:hypothetical protein
VLKIDGIRGLYRDEHTQVYFHRIQSQVRNTYQSLGAKRQDQAIKNIVYRILSPTQR